MPPYRALGTYLEHPGVPLREALAYAERAEALGFGIAAVGEGWEDGFSLVGALAARTSRVEIVSAIATWTRSPVTTALAAATASELSRGRYRLGLGSIARAWSEGWHAIEAARPVERMRDYVAAIRAALLAVPGEPAGYEGPFYRFRDYDRPAPPPAAPIPLYLGASRPGMVALAGEVADGVVYSSLLPLSWLREVCLPALATGRARAGRPDDGVDRGMVVFCAVDDDRDRARDLMRPCLAFHLPHFGDVASHAGYGRELAAIRAAAAKRDAAAMAAAVTDEMVDAMAVVGPSSRVRAELERYEGLIDWPVLMPPIGLDAETSRLQVERILTAFAPSRA